MKPDNVLCRLGCSLRVQRLGLGSWAFILLMGLGLMASPAEPGEEFKSSATKLSQMDAEDLLFSNCDQPGFEAWRLGLPAEEAQAMLGLGSGRCTQIRVFEDRTRKAGRTIDLKVMILPATGKTVKPDPIYAITGGPGGSIIASQWISLLLQEARGERDLVLVDQRGTGGSNPLACLGINDQVEDVFKDVWLDPEVLAACRRALEKKADLRFYTTEWAVEDLEEVRRTLGHDQINLWGASYGTQVVQVYLKRYPESIRSAVLEGVAPLDLRPPLEHASGAQVALGRWLERCAQEKECRRKYPDPGRDLRRILQRLESSSVEAKLKDPLTGDSVRVTLGRNAFAEKLRGMLYSADQAANIPRFLRRAAEGDFTHLLEQMLARERAVFSEGRTWFTGLFLSVTCSESLPYIGDGEAKQRSAETFLGTFRVDQQRAACQQWVRGSIPADFHRPVRSAVPVLLLNGALDPVTLTGGTTEVAKHLSRGRLIELPHSSHAPTDPACSSSLTGAFYRSADAQKLDTSCVDKIRPVPWG